MGNVHTVVTYIQKIYFTYIILIFHAFREQNSKYEQYLGKNMWIETFFKFLIL